MSGKVCPLAFILSRDPNAVRFQGRKGIGTRKRALSPTVVERIAKMAKMQETSSHATFRDRAMQEYAERRAEGRLRAYRLLPSLLVS